jgi:hypothetical protein
MIKDYVRNKFATLELRDQIEQYWHKKGYTWVKVWVEDFKREGQPTEFYIRSNIVYKVP